MTATASGTVLEVGATGESSHRGALEDKGHVVLGCGGPDGKPCPLVEGKGCSLVDSAMGVVFRLDLDDSYNREILKCYREELSRDIPIQVIVKAGDEELYADDLAGTVVLTEDSRSALEDFSDQVALVDMARQALSDLAGPPAGRRNGNREEVDGISFEWLR